MRIRSFMVWCIVFERNNKLTVSSFACLSSLIPHSRVRLNSEKLWSRLARRKDVSLHLWLYYDPPFARFGKGGGDGMGIFIRRGWV